MLAETWSLLAQSAPFLLVGFALAGAVEATLAGAWIARWMAGERLRSVLAAAAVGVPLPLCSCSVVPTAMALRRRGAGRGATVSFLVSTPETSVTSILLTYALLGPVLAIARPVAATLTAIVAGLAESSRTRGRRDDASPRDDEHESDARLVAARPAAGLLERLRGGWRFAFVDLFDDIFGWMALGLLLAGALAAWLPNDALLHLPGGRLGAMAAMVVLGVPLYVCAEASTPVAAALIAQGLSPGAALVFLLVGPATNLGAVGVLARTFGRATVVLYLVVIVVVALGAGLALDAWIAPGTTSPATAGGLAGAAASPGVLPTAAAVVFLALGLGTLRRRGWRRLLAE